MFRSIKNVSFFQESNDTSNAERLSPMYVADGEVFGFFPPKPIFFQKGVYENVTQFTIVSPCYENWLLGAAKEPVIEKSKAQIYENVAFLEPAASCTSNYENVLCFSSPKPANNGYENIDLLADPPLAVEPDQTEEPVIETVPANLVYDYLVRMEDLINESFMNGSLLDDLTLLDNWRSLYCAACKSTSLFDSSVLSQDRLMVHKKWLTDFHEMAEVTFDNEDVVEKLSEIIEALADLTSYEEETSEHDCYQEFSF